MKSWSDYFDSNGLLVQKDMDGGDTASHEGVARTLANFLPTGYYPSPLDIQVVVSRLVRPDNLLIRNPIRYNDPFDKDYGTSRDQYRSFIAAMSLNGLDANVVEMRNALPKNFLGLRKYPNGDFYSPEDETIFNRRHQNWFSRALGDLCTLLNSLLICFWVTRIHGKSDTSNDIDHIAVCIQGACIKPTIFNRLARWVYGKFRPGGVQ